MHRSKFILFLLLCAILGSLGGYAQSTQASWTTVGQGLTNLRQQPLETTLSISTVSKLAVKWIFTTGGDVTATPTVSNGVVYVPDAVGNLFAIDAATGHEIWTHTISSYVHMANAISRVSPAIYQDELIVGDNLSLNAVHAGAHVFAVSQKDGSLLWSTQVESHLAAIITSSPVVYNNVIYVGVSSMEEAFAAFKGYACCTFRGSIVALNATTGALLWQTYMVPENQGQPGEYSGGSIWGPPAIDISNNLLFIGTGNNYSVPASVEACEKAQTAKQCEAPTNMFDSFVALNLTNGAIKWAQSAVPYDTANLACGLTPPDTNCPNPHGPDYDFSGGGPNLVNGTVGAGQKSGYYHMLNATTGVPVWSVGIGPGGPLGGILWGTASDGSSIFIASANSSKKSVKLVSGQTITWGFWTALDAKTGKVLWQTPEPTQGTAAISSMSTANGLVYVGSADDAGQMYAVDAATGKVLWSYTSGGSVLGAPSIVDGVLYWGSGYSRLGGSGNKKLYAFALP